MQVLNLTSSERLTLEAALLDALTNMVRKDNYGNVLDKSDTTSVALTTVSATRVSVTFIYTHDDSNIASPAVWQVPITALRMYFNDKSMAVLSRHGVINN